MALFDGFNIDNFRSSFSRGEPQRSAFFDVLLIPPMSLVASAAATGIAQASVGGSGGVLRTIADFRLRCSAINLPGKNISTFDYEPIVGPVVKIANGSRYDELQMEVIMSSTGLERQLMAAWIEFINPTQIYNMNVRYFDNYTGSLLLSLYSSDGKVSQVVRIANAFPTAISSIEHRWADVNSYTTFRVAFSFESMQVVAPHELPSGAFDLLPVPELDIGSILLNAAASLAG